MILGAAIRRLREDRGWTQDELASRAGMNASYLGLVERRENVPTLTVIVLLAETRCGRRRLGETSRKMMLLLASLPVRLTFFHSAATCLHVPARLTRESAKREGRKPRTNERHVVGCCE